MQRNTFYKPRNTNANQVNTRIPNDFLNRLDKKVLPRNFRLQKWSPQFQFLIENIPSLSQEWTRIAEFWLATGLSSIQSKYLPWLSTRWQLLKRLRQTVLDLNRGIQRCQRYAYTLSARYAFAVVFKPFDRSVFHRRRIPRFFKEDTYVKRITLVIWTTARLPRFPIRGTLFRYTPEGFSFWDMEHFSIDLHIFLGNIRRTELENNNFML